MKSYVFLTFLSLALSLPAFADADPMNKEVGNGGDACEKRFQRVTEEIQSWIHRGGPASLELPEGTSLDQYNKKMIAEITAAKVSCVDEVLKVGAAEKTCKNTHNKAGESLITCNSKRFNETSDSEQYLLVHHEYAGLAGLEVNEAEKSQYTLSNQLSAYLYDEVVKKLAIKPQQPQGPNKLRENFADFVGKYEIISCKYQSTRGSTDQACRGALSAEITLQKYPTELDRGEILEVQFEQDPAFTGDFVSSITLADELNKVGQRCSNFRGKQYCESENTEGDSTRYTSSLRIRTIGGLTYLDDEASYRDDPAQLWNYWTMSIVLKRKGTE